MTSLSINVKSSGGGKYQLDLPNLTETVGAFKVRLAAVSDIPADSQRLIFRGHVLKDMQTFQEIRDKHGLETGQTMHVVRGASAASRATSTAATQTAPTPPPASGAGPAPGMMPSGIPGMPPGMMQNPEQMAAVLNSPIMESIMNNPELARSMMMANPQLREVIERNPEVGHVFNDPATFRQMMQLARNPSLMQEMMRNTDRQMANLEMMPGGFDALRRMQEDIQAPLMDAVQNFGGNNTESNNNASTDSNNNANPFAGLFQNTPSQAPMPNPWAPNNGVPPSAGGTANPTPATGTATGAGATASTGTGTTAAAGTAPAGTGGTTAGMPDWASMMGGMAGAGMNNDQVAQMMDSPMVQRMMQLMASDPGMLEAMINSNPQLRQLADTNPQMAQALRNPEFMRTMLNPDMMRSMMQFRQMMGGVPGRMPGTAPRAGTTPSTETAATGTTGTAGGAGTGTPGAQDIGSLMAMMNALGGLGGAPGSGASAQQPELSNEQLEEMYASQLQQLRDMGFLDTNMCLQALRRSNGNVHVAVENLLNQLGG